MGWRPNRVFLGEKGRKLKSTFGIPRITEKTRCHGSSAKHIYNPTTRGYQPRIRSTVGGGGGGCNNFVPVLRRNGTKIAPTGDMFDEVPGQMR